MLTAITTGFMQSQLEYLQDYAIITSTEQHQVKLRSAYELAGSNDADTMHSCTVDL